MTDLVMASGEWNNNAELIADVAKLGYLHKEWRTCDPTYGRGKFWTIWRPDQLIASDIKGGECDKLDGRHLPYHDGSFQAVVIDGPYKLNGTPSGEVDERYGVDVPQTIPQRHQLLRELMTEGVRVLGIGGVLLFKCQDQVANGRMHWQTDMFTDHARALQLAKVARFDIRSYRKQPAGRRQLHPRNNRSQLLVFVRKSDKWEHRY